MITSRYSIIPFWFQFCFRFGYYLYFFYFFIHFLQLHLQFRSFLFRVEFLLPLRSLFIAQINIPKMKANDPAITINSPINAGMLE
jgi:hypothetical protein